MRHIGTFSVVGFRESWALFQWAGASMLCGPLHLALGYALGLIAALLSALIDPTWSYSDSSQARCTPASSDWLTSSDTQALSR